MKQFLWRWTVGAGFEVTLKQFPGCEPSALLAASLEVIEAGTISDCQMATICIEQTNAGQTFLDDNSLLRNPQLVLFDVAHFGFVCHWLSQLHPEIRLQLGKASEPKRLLSSHSRHANVWTVWTIDSEVIVVAKHRRLRHSSPPANVITLLARVTVRQLSNSGDSRARCIGVGTNNGL